MERLTYDFCIAGKHCWQVKGTDNLECGEVCKSRDDEGCNGCPIADAFDRLAAIEDILGDEYNLEYLKWLVEAEREGRCVVLPCKIGSKLYSTSMRKMQVYEVSVGREYFHDSKNNATLFAVQIFENGKKSTSYECFKEKDIGKTVFLTRKEAEDALEKMKGGNE